MGLCAALPTAMSIVFCLWIACAAMAEGCRNSAGTVQEQQAVTGRMLESIKIGRTVLKERKRRAGKVS